MNRINMDELLDKLIGIYTGSFDMQQPYTVESDTYDAYGLCDITNAKYVLVKKAELWRAICHEHVFFRCFDEITVENILHFTHQTKSYIEPELVRQGKTVMEKDHMYTYVTGVFLCQNGISEEVVKQIKKTRFYKNYRMSVRGYCELRLLVVDLKNQRLVGNRAARDLIKDYKKFL